MYLFLIQCKEEGGNEDRGTAAVEASHFFGTENCINFHIKGYKGYITAEKYYNAKNFNRFKINTNV